jgi:hypothetical protein
VPFRDHRSALPGQRWRALPPLVAGACVVALWGCGSSASPRTPTSSELARLRGHLAVAEGAAGRRDRAGATAALNAIAQDVQVLARAGTLSPTLAATLVTEVAQARRRASIELPAPAPVTTAAPPAAATTRAAPAPATAAPVGNGPGKDHPGRGPGAKPPKPPKPADHGKHKGHGDGGD